MDWILYAVLSTLFLGVAMSLYKIPSFKNYSSHVSTIWTNAFSFIFVVTALLIFDYKLLIGLKDISWYAFLWGALFATTMVLQKKLLHDVDTASAYSITSSVGSLITVLIGVKILAEQISIIQALGIIIVLLAVFIYTRKSSPLTLTKRTVWFCLGIVGVSTASKYVQKLGAITDSVSQFMLWQFIGATLFALLVAYIFEKDKFSDVINYKRYFKGSALISFFLVSGAYFILKALSLGPLSGVYAIHPAYTFIAGILGYIFFGEQFTKKKVILALASVLGIILLRVG